MQGLRVSRLSSACLSLPLLFLFCALNAPVDAQLAVVHDRDKQQILVYRVDKDGNLAAAPVLAQNARADFRPYLHPIQAPDGNGILTQASPSHHKHQTGLYWGFTRVNDRDYFHHPEGDYWRRAGVNVLKPATTSGDSSVSWSTVYDMLDAEGNSVLRETQTWSLKDEGTRYVLDLVWNGAAKTEVTVGEYDYGGLFLRMPWTEKTLSLIHI